MTEATVFLLAFLGYAALAACAVGWAVGRLPRALTVATAAVVAVHVGGVWTVRYAGSVERALANGAGPFLVFHAALALVLAAAMAPARWSGRCAAAAFPIVTAGALGAAFRRPEVAGYRWPLVAVAMLAFALGAVAWRRAGRATTP
jgi:hypothetical protein